MTVVTALVSNCEVVAELRTRRRAWLRPRGPLPGSPPRRKPYSPQTIGAYTDAVASLAGWLAEAGYPGGFEQLSVADLNGYLSAYREEHTQGGVVTKQQNLRVFLLAKPRHDVAVRSRSIGA